MEQASIPKEIIEELKMIRRDLDYIKKHMIDVDTILTIDEERRLEESLEEYKEGKTINFLRRSRKETYNRIIKKIKELSSDPFTTDAKRIIGRSYLICGPL